MSLNIDFESCRQLESRVMYMTLSGQIYGLAGELGDMPVLTKEPTQHSSKACASSCQITMWCCTYTQQASLVANL